MNLLPEPNMKAKPNAQNRSPHKHVSTMPSSRMLTVSRVRENPASSIMKPACMKNTRKAAISVHIVLIGLIRSVAAGGGAPSAEAFDEKYQRAAHTPARADAAHS